MTFKQIRVGEIFYDDRGDGWRCITEVVYKNAQGQRRRFNAVAIDRNYPKSQHRAYVRHFQPSEVVRHTK